jgi:hypothetical protein
VSQSFLFVFPYLSVRTMATGQTCCHPPGEMLNLAAKAVDRARIGTCCACGIWSHVTSHFSMSRMSWVQKLRLADKTTTRVKLCPKSWFQHGCNGPCPKSWWCRSAWLWPTKFICSKCYPEKSTLSRGTIEDDKT